jgi:hypothetical protein
MNSQAENPPAEPLHLDEQGVPILEDVVDDTFLDQLAEEIKQALLTELEPQLHSMVRSAFATSVKAVALELKHTFEQKLDETMKARLRVLVEQAVERAIAGGAFD